MLTVFSRKHRIVLGVLLFLSFISNAQVPFNKDLELLLKGKDKYEDVMAIVSKYYMDRNYANDPVLYREFKKWSRWAWWESLHLDENGKFFNSNAKTTQTLMNIRNGATNGMNSPMSNTGAWSFLGPSFINNGTARVDRIAFHPTNPSIIYAGTPNGGLWKSTDGGANWSALTGFLPNIGVSGIVIDADDPNIIYVLSGDGDSNANGSYVYSRKSIGLLRSTDGGITWQIYSYIINNPSVDYYGFKLYQSRHFSNVMYACTSKGLYRSTNKGVNWQVVSITSNITIYDVEEAPLGGDITKVFAISQYSFFISSNFGASFTFPNPAISPIPSSGSDRGSIAVSAQSPATVYIHFGGTSGSSTEKKLYRSTDYGVNFTLINNNAPVTSGDMCAFAVSPSDASKLIIANIGIIRSIDGGFNFTDTLGGMHADFHDLQYNPLNNFLYAATDGGVYRSTDNGTTWTYLNNGLAATQYYHMTATALDNNIVLGGTQDNGFTGRKSGGQFGLVAGGDGFSGQFFNNSVDSFIFSVNAGVFKGKLASGAVFPLLNTAANMINNYSFFFPHLAIHPTDNKIMYAGYIDGLRRSIDGGVTWTNLGGSGSAGFSFAGGLAVSPSIPDKLYMANGSVLRVSNDKGTTFSVISGTSGWPASTGLITDVVARPNDGNEVWVTFSGFSGPRVLYSSNGGASWVDFSGSLPALPVYCIQYTSGGDAYIGTDAGVYYMAFTMNDWVFFSNGLPMVPVTDLYYNESLGTLKASTFGRGIWWGDSYSPCQPFVSLTGSSNGRNFYQSSGTIETTQQLPATLGPDNTYRAGQVIRIKPGFSSLKGSKVKAVIGPCGQGVVNAGGAVMTKAEKLSLQ